MAAAPATIFPAIDDPRPAGHYAPGAPGPCTVISIRRFAARPCGVSLDATGWVSPKPLAETMLGLIPCETRKVATVAARRVDKTRLSGTPWRCSSGPTGVLSVYPYTTILAFCRPLSRGTTLLAISACPAGPI